MQTPGEKVLKDRRSPRERGRMGTSVNNNAPDDISTGTTFSTVSVGPSAIPPGPAVAFTYSSSHAKTSTSQCTDISVGGRDEL